MLNFLNKDKILYIHDATLKWDEHLKKDATKQGFKSWGPLLSKAAEENGLKVKFFNSADEVQNSRNSIVFIYMMVLGIENYKKLMTLAEQIHKKRKITLLTKPVEGKTLHNKALLAKLYASWMPETWHIKSNEEAKLILSGAEGAKGIKYPIISKSASGFGSNNVRFIKDRDAAEKEISMAFSEQGIPMFTYEKVSKKHKQAGYLLWQKFLPNNEFDFRVHVIAKKYAACAKRYNRKDRPFASGSNDMEVCEQVDNEVAGALNFALDFVKKNDLFFAVLDVLKNEKGEFRIIESHCMCGIKFKKKMFEKCNGGWQPARRSYADMFDLIAKCIKEGEF